MSDEEEENIALEENEQTSSQRYGIQRLDQLSDESEVGRFQGHTTPALSLCYAPQAGLLITGGDDETVRLFDVQTKAQLSVLQGGHWLVSPVRAVAITPDGGNVFVAARENTIRVLRLISPTELSPETSAFVGHDHWVRALSLNWRLRLLASAGNDSTVRVWNIDTGNEVRRFQANTRAVAVSLNDRMVVAGFHDNLARGYLLDDDESPILEFSGHTGWVISVALGRKLLVTGSLDATARVFDSESQECLCVLRGHAHSVNAVALCTTEQRAVTGSNDSSLIYWSLDNGGQPLLRISSNFGSVRCIIFLRSANEICFSGWDGSVRIYDIHLVDNMRILALCSASHNRLGKDAPICRIANRDILARVRLFLLKTVRKDVAQV